MATALQKFVNFVVANDGALDSRLRELVEEAAAEFETPGESDSLSEEEVLELFAKVLGDTTKKKKTTALLKKALGKVVDERVQDKMQPLIKQLSSLVEALDDRPLSGMTRGAPPQPEMHATQYQPSPQYQSPSQYQQPPAGYGLQYAAHGPFCTPPTATPCFYSAPASTPPAETRSVTSNLVGALANLAAELQKFS
jgi:hypothetical protein